MTSNVSATSTTGLYGISGNIRVPTSAQQLLNLLYSNGNVDFSLANSNTQVQANALGGGGGGSYGNVDVAAFLPVYNGDINAAVVFGQGLPIQGYDFVQMQYTNGAALPVSPYDIGTGSWLYVDSGGATFQSNTTGTLTQVVIGNDGGINAQGNIVTDGKLITTNGVFWANGDPYSSGGGGSTYGNANVAAYLSSNTDPTISNLNANAAVQATQINTLNANVGAFETYANLTFSTTANAASQQTSINTLNANVGAFELYANANIGTLYLGNISTNANLGAFQTYANLTFSTGGGSNYGNANVAAYLSSNTDPTISNLNANSAVQAVAINTLNANVGAFELYANANIGTLYLGNISTNANVGAFQTYANLTFSTVANAASQQTSINTLNANVGAFETYANSTFLTSTTGVTQIIAGANITISPVGGTGAVTVTANTQAGTYTNSNVTNLLSGGAYTGDLNAPTGVVTAAAINSTGQLTANTYLQANNGLYSLGAITEAYTDGIVVDYTTGNGRISVGTADALTFYAGGPGANSTAVIYPNGNTVIGGSATVGNLITTNGVFWSNGTSYSTGGGSSFNGNLAGSSLSDSVNLRIFGNATPFSQADNTVPGNDFSNSIVYKPVYTNGQLQQPPLANATVDGSGVVSASGQTIGFAQTANIALQSGYGSQNRNTIAQYNLLTVTPVTANSMSNNDRVRASLSTIDINLAGKTWGTMSSNSQNATTIAAMNGVVSVAGSGSISTAVGGAYGAFITPSSTGTANVQYATSLMSFQALQATAGTGAKANVVYARGLGFAWSGFSSNLTIQTAVGVHTHSGWAGSGAVGTANNPILGRYAILNEDVNTTIQTNGNVTITGNTNLNAYKETIYVAGNQSGTLTISSTNGTVQTLTATGNITVNTNNLLSFPAGSSVTLVITQDGTGNRLLTSNLKYAGNSKTLSTAASSIDVVNIFYDGTNYLASLVKGYV